LIAKLLQHIKSSGIYVQIAQGSFKVRAKLKYLIEIMIIDETI